MIGVASSAWQVGVLRAGAWAARGLRVPARNALLADVVPASAYGRAYGFERAMDNLGAIGGPLLALGLVRIVGVRRRSCSASFRDCLRSRRSCTRFAIPRSRPSANADRSDYGFDRSCEVGCGRLMVGVSAFEFGNVAATLLILRVTDLLAPGHGEDDAARIAIALYVLYNLAATLTSIPAGQVGDRRGMVRVLAVGIAAFAFAYIAFAGAGASIPVLGAAFAVAGVGIGCVETAEHAAVATLAPESLRGSAFGLLAAVQSFGNLAASSIAGLLYTIASPGAAFAYAAVFMLLALIALAATMRRA